MQAPEQPPPIWNVPLPNGAILALRRLQMEDAEAFHAATLETVGELTRWFDWCHDAWTIEECRAMLAQLTADDRGESRHWFVALLDSGPLVAAGWLNRLDPQHRFGNLGYWVRASQGGRGIAAAMAARLARFGFEELGLTRIEVVVDVANRASQRVAQKLGARREGVLRWRLVHHGRPHDAVMYSLVRGRMA